MRIILVILISLFLTNCTATRSNVGATLGATTTTAACVNMGTTDPYMIAGCAVVGAFAEPLRLVTTDLSNEPVEFATPPNGTLVVG